MSGWPRTADAVIVGGGCMGASAAYHLATRGLTDVVLVEREAQLGLGSTGRNAGGFRHQFSHESNIRLSLESVALLQRFEEVVGSPVDVHQDGYLILLSSAESFDAVGRDVALQRRMGVPTEILTPDEAARRAPGLRVDGLAGATFCGRDGIADPNGVTMGFAKAAQALGVRVERGTEVTGIDVDGGGRIAGVRTSRGDVATPIVIDAAGPWARPVAALAGVEVPIEPARRHIFIAQPPTRAGWAPGSVPDSRVLVIDVATTFYFHREGGNMLFGMGPAREAPTFDTTVQWDFLEAITPVAGRRLPALADAPIARAWAGLYEMTPDAMPIIGPAAERPGFWLIAGFSGHGFQHSPAAGRVLADLVTGREVGEIDLSPFALERFRDGRCGVGEARVF
jgi:sarcosine oxidase subunit beta